MDEKEERMDKDNSNENVISKKIQQIIEKSTLTKLETARLHYLGGDTKDLFEDPTKLETEIFQIFKCNDFTMIEKKGGYQGLIGKIGEQNKDCPQRDFLRREVIRMKYLQEVFILKLWALMAKADKYKAELLEKFFSEQISFQQFSLKVLTILYYQNLKKIELEQKVGRAAKIIELYESQIGKVPVFTMPTIRNFLKKQEKNYKAGIENLAYSNLFQKYELKTYLEYKERIQKNQFSREELLKGLFSGNVERVFVKIFPSSEDKEKENMLQKRNVI